MRVAIVDDSLTDIQLLFDNICRYCQEHKVHMQIDKFSNEALFLHSFKNSPYDLIFLDIYMQQATGIQIAKKVQEINPRCQIVFTTTSKEHAVKAFRLHALDYLVKPYTYSQLEDALNHFEHLSRKFTHYIELKEGRHFTRILISDIIYTDYYNHYIQVHTTSNIVRSYMPFDNFAPMLEPYPQFLWCYRNCMVNMDYIESLDDKDFILKNEERIPISKARKKEIVQAYADYVFDYVNGGGSL